MLEREFYVLMEEPQVLARRLERLSVSEVDQQRENADAARTAAQQRVAKLKARKARLVEVYAFKGGIDQETYAEQLGRISAELDAPELDGLAYEPDEDFEPRQAPRSSGLLELPGDSA